MTAVDIRTAICGAYRTLARGRGDWVAIAALRHRLAGLDQRQVTAELRAMERDRVANLVPQANQKVLTPADHAAAVPVGPDRCHLVSIA